MSERSEGDIALDPADVVAGWEDGFLRIGSGELGGKANGLVFFRDMLGAEYDAAKLKGIQVAVPSFAVLTTEVFDRFVAENDLDAVAAAGYDDAEIAARFQAAALPAAVTSALATLVDHVRVPLSVRSSGALEDAIFCPFAGVYRTKMIPNNEPAPEERLRSLELAVKLVLASTFFETARLSRQAMGKVASAEKMAVIVQRTVGTVHGDRFYPQLAGVARSHDFYAGAGARAEDGVVNLALGLGKSIVDGGSCWGYSPVRPQAPPPFGSVDELLRNSQLDFWYLDLDRSTHDPVDDGEFLARGDLAVAERDGALQLVASTYDARSDRLVPGTGPAGPRALNFAPLLSLRLLPLNDVIRELLDICERAAGGEVEIEFAMSVDGPSGDGARLGFLQVRPMVVSHETVVIEEAELARDDVMLATSRVLGNGIETGIRDLVVVRRDGFEARHTPAVAREVEELNRELVAERLPYLLIGFGRWGSSDPWLGVPVTWGQISGARVIVESTLAHMNVEPSQGSHFFHNISSTGVSYLTVHHESEPGIDWDRLQSLAPHRTLERVSHLKLSRPVLVKIDGRSGRGAVWWNGEPGEAG